MSDSKVNVGRQLSKHTLTRSIHRDPHRSEHQIQGKSVHWGKLTTQGVSCVPLTPEGLEDRWCGPTEVNMAIKQGIIPPIDCHLCSSLPRAVQSALPFMVAIDEAAAVREATAGADTIDCNDATVSADSNEHCTWRFVILDLLRELPGRVAPEVGDLVDLSNFHRLGGAEVGNNEAEYQSLSDAFSKTMHLVSTRGGEYSRWRREVERSISKACLDFLVNLALDVNDRTSQSECQVQLSW